MARSRIRLDPNLEAELAGMAGLRATIDRAADAVADRARTSARMSGGKAFARTAKNVTRAPDGGHRVQVGAAGPFAHIEEWGSINSAPQATLRNAVRSTGLTLDEASK